MDKAVSGEEALKQELWTHVSLSRENSNWELFPERGGRGEVSGGSLTSTLVESLTSQEAYRSPLQESLTSVEAQVRTLLRDFIT